MSKRILVVEDEEDIRDLMVLRLSREDYQVDAVADGEAAMKYIKDLAGNPFNLLVLDWMLPGVSGIDLAKAARSLSQVPILMVTARAETADVVLGLETGADDYVTKPFDIPVFLARVRALLRRSAAMQSASDKKIHELGGITVDEELVEMKCDGVPVHLTISEFKLLVALIKNQGRVLTRTALVDLVQGTDVSVVDRTIDTHVFGLRKKLGKYGDLIETVRGVGYRVQSGS